MAVGSLEPKFYAALLEGLGLTETAPDRYDLAQHDALRESIAKRFGEKTQAEWTEIFEGTDACVSPVLPLTEAAEHPHIKARGTYVDSDGVLQPAPAPRFSRTAATLSTGPTAPGGQSRDALTVWGIADVDSLLTDGVVTQS